jgi:hypothetical protein
MKMLFKSPRLWWKFEGRYYHKDIYNGVKNLIKWFPIIWRDRDWDQSYIYTILQKKLELHAEGIAKRDILVSSQRDAEMMRTSARLIEKIKNDYYDSEYTDYSEDKYWFETIPDRPGLSTMEHELISENFDDYFKKYPLIYKRVLNGEGMFPIKEISEVGEYKKTIAKNIAHINQDRARKLLFNILESQIEGWWD